MKCERCKKEIKSIDDVKYSQYGEMIYKVFLNAEGKRKMKDKLVKIGAVGVDSGQLVITDPCYIDAFWEKDSELKFTNKEVKGFSYNACCNKQEKTFKQIKYPIGHNGLAVVFDSGLGDGYYEVYAKIGKVAFAGERIKEVIIKLIEEE